MIGGADRLLRAGSAAASLLLALLPTMAASVEPPQKIDDYGEIQEHLIDPRPVISTPWSDETEDHDRPTWNFDLTVNESGNVSATILTSGARDLRDQATRAVQALRFRPFVRDGRPVPVRLEFMVWSRPRDYSGPADRNFPANPDLSTTVVALSRSGCLGSCPSYRVELRGNGEIHFSGDRDVLVRGSHRWRIDPATVATLLELFRRGNYFTLLGYYEYPVTDLPTYVTRLSIGEQSKFVLDYGGSGFGGAAASTSMPGEVPDMPSVVTEIEEAIDKASGALSYVSGDDTTLQKLRDERWNFRSQDAGNGVRILLSACKTALAREFIRAGAPLNVVGDGYGAGLPISFAAQCADVDLVRLMMNKGALRSRRDAKSFLWASVGSGHPAMVALALTRYRDVNAKNGEGAPLLAHAAGSYVNDDAVNAASFDSARVVEMLVDAGANPNARDADGKTPIFEANSGAVASALLKEGADPNARDDEGRTALFDHYFDEPKAVLLAAGADVNARDKLGSTALFFQDDPISIKVLLDAGAAIDVVNSKSHTAIEQMNSEGAVLALLAAGAKFPADPDRLDDMIDRASARQWPEVLARLRDAAGK